MKGRWAAGIVPRNFSWIIKDHLALSERPGGSAPDHRRVRRQEEILWLRAQGFTRVVSLLSSTHNLHAYEELGLEYSHVPMGVHANIPTVLGELYPKLLGWLHAGDRILVHQDELGDRVAGVFAGFLWWSGLIPEPPLAISAIEHLLRRQLGSAGRTIATLAMEVPPPPEEDRRHPAPPPEETIVALRPEDRETVEPREPALVGRDRPTTPAVTETASATVADISLRRPAARPRRRPVPVTGPRIVSALKPTRTAPRPVKAPARKAVAQVAKTPSRAAPRPVKAPARKVVAQVAKTPSRTAPRPVKAPARKAVAQVAKTPSRTAPRPVKAPARKAVAQLAKTPSRTAPRPVKAPARKAVAKATSRKAVAKVAPTPARRPASKATAVRGGGGTRVTKQARPVSGPAPARRRIGAR